MRRRFLTDAEGIDTIPLKMIVYLAITGCVLALVAISWNTIVPLKQGYDVEKQLSEASLELLSLQKGKARDLSLFSSAQGSMCSLELDFPREITYLGFGVDPDPDNDGNVTNSAWDIENNTIIYRYNNGVKKRWIIEGEKIHFCQGRLSAGGTWLPEEISDPSNNMGMGVVIEKPISGTYVFELVRSDGTFTLSHFS
ncbi:hypothetical protein Metho_0572 [Methanomethylovorans hollandica DSM 15978]|uniref:Uncharacterized protein n=1 Tax=Methanomethylovorans hollandica (strain DSM 15978 / NBRC 107637 / DMS1) TaxID=867904 RepID=L0KTV7_METHD|nr:hypothetical protein [Methanomethylovorans hollandica]AGB48837.1 hypothetical protein Metho_0572 [Methanomethylovorans hollandica DSM 15978]